VLPVAFRGSAVLGTVVGACEENGAGKSDAYYSNWTLIGGKPVNIPFPQGASQSILSRFLSQGSRFIKPASKVVPLSHGSTKIHSKRQAVNNGTVMINTY
jgi:hypothetical protein